jgi:hypothetical protein
MKNKFQFILLTDWFPFGFFKKRYIPARELEVSHDVLVLKRDLASGAGATARSGDGRSPE